MKLQIADWLMQVDCDDAVTGQLPNLCPFLVSDPLSSDADILFRLQMGVSLSPEKTVPVLVNELEGRTLRLWLMPDHCSISLTLADSRQTYWLRASRDWKQIVSDWKPDYPGSYSVLNDFLMIAFIYSSAFRDTVLLHASCVAVGSEGCAFIGPSGVGKSTHSRLWLEHIPDSRLLNDDQPVLRRMPDGSMRIYGSPWSGKTFATATRESVSARCFSWSRQQKIVPFVWTVFIRSVVCSKPHRPSGATPEPFRRSVKRWLG